MIATAGTKHAQEEAVIGTPYGVPVKRRKEDLKHMLSGVAVADAGESLTRQQKHGALARGAIPGNASR